MPSNAAKLSTDFLTAEQMRDAVSALPSVLLSLLGEHELTASYGWGAKIHGDLYYKPMRVNTQWVQFLIEDSVEQRIIVPGGSDFHFDVPPERLHITFCHESDIHLDGEDEELLQQFISAEPYSKFHWNTREEVQGMFVDT